MIIRDFDLVSVTVTPEKADPILVVDADAVLSRSVPFERLQSISGKDRKIRKDASSVKLDEFSLNNLRKPIETLRITRPKYQFCVFGSKRSNHQKSV
jgi:hypothetical protein